MADIDTSTGRPVAENEVTSAHNVPRLDDLLTPVAHNNLAGDLLVASNSGLDSPAIYLVDGVDSETGFQLLGNSKLDQRDLEELVPEQSFPERFIPKPPSEIVSGYPSSELDISYFPRIDATGTSLLDVAEARSSVRHDEIPTLVSCMDLREKQLGMYSVSRFRIPRRPESTIKADVALFFSCSEDVVKEAPVSKVSPPVLYVIGEMVSENLHLVVHYRNSIGFLVIRHDYSLDKGLSLCRDWLQLVGAHYVLLRQNGTKLDQGAAFTELVDLEQLNLVRAEAYMLKFLVRISQRTDKTFYVECDDTDYVREIKEKFLNAFREEDKDTAVSMLKDARCLWLTSGERVVQDSEMLRSIWTARLEDDLSIDQTSAEVTSNDMFQVHFQPVDAVLVKFNFKSEARKYQKSESLILLSPQASVQQLREEIAKVTHWDPSSFKVFIHGKKLEMNTALEPFLRMPNCIAVVEQRPKIQLKVVIDGDSAALQPAAESNLVVCMHKHERVGKLKQEICNRLHVPLYCVDLLGGGSDDKTIATTTPGNSNSSAVELRESDDLRTARLRDGDRVRAAVYPNRVLLSVRLAAGMWEDVLVDDVSVSTVKQLKAFSRSALLQRYPDAVGSGDLALQFSSHNVGDTVAANRRGEDPNGNAVGGATAAEVEPHHCQQGNAQQVGRTPPDDPLREKLASAARGTLVMHAIFRGQALSDLATLRDAGLEMNSRVVLVQEVKLCFTVKPPGFVPLFFARGSDDYQPPERIMAMCDGKSFMRSLDPEEIKRTSSEPPYLMRPPSTSTAARLPPGIRSCPSRLKDQFPQQRRQRVILSPRVHHPPRLPPSGQAGGALCHVCRSMSTPNFAPAHATATQNRMPHSRSETFHHQLMPTTSPTFCPQPRLQDNGSGGRTVEVGQHRNNNKNSSSNNSYNNMAAATQTSGPRHSTPIKDNNWSGCGGDGGFGGHDAGVSSFDSTDCPGGRTEAGSSVGAVGIAASAVVGGQDSSAGGAGTSPVAGKMKRRPSLSLKVNNSPELTAEERTMWKLQQQQQQQQHHHHQQQQQHQQQQHQQQHHHQQQQQQQYQGRQQQGQAAGSGGEQRPTPPHQHYCCPPPQNYNHNDNNNNSIPNLLLSDTARSWVNPRDLPGTLPPFSNKTHTYGIPTGYFSENEAMVRHPNGHKRAAAAAARRQHQGNPPPRQQQQPQPPPPHQQQPRHQPLPPPHSNGSHNDLYHTGNLSPRGVSSIDYIRSQSGSSGQWSSLAGSTRTPASAQSVESSTVCPSDLSFLTPSPGDKYDNNGGYLYHRGDDLATGPPLQQYRTNPVGPHYNPPHGSPLDNQPRRPANMYEYHYQENSNYNQRTVTHRIHTQGPIAPEGARPLWPVGPAGFAFPVQHQNDVRAVVPVAQNDTRAVVPVAQNDTRAVVPVAQNDTRAVVPVAQNDTRAVVPTSQNERCTFSTQDPAFAYVSKSIITELAHSLGSEWPRIIFRLVDESDVSNADSRSQGDPYRRNFYCLRIWCQKHGSSATWENLKKVLIDCERMELVEHLENSGYKTV